jgi:hypothetical protein
MENMDYIRAQLQRRTAERQLPTVAKRSGVGLRTLRRIIAGDGGCNYATVKQLDEFLRRTEKAKRLDDDAI